MSVATAWFSLRLDAIGFLVLAAASLLAVASRIDPSVAGLSLMYAQELTKFLKFGTRVISKTETDFNSVERIAQYLQVASPLDCKLHIRELAMCSLLVKTCLSIACLFALGVVRSRSVILWFKRLEFWNVSVHMLHAFVWFVVC
jgi:hypothetical protein